MNNLWNNLASKERGAAFTSLLKDAVNTMESHLDKVLDISPGKEDQDHKPLEDDFFTLMFNSPSKKNETLAEASKPKTQKSILPAIPKSAEPVPLKLGKSDILETSSETSGELQGVNFDLHPVDTLQNVSISPSESKILNIKEDEIINNNYLPPVIDDLKNPPEPGNPVLTPTSHETRVDDISFSDIEMIRTKSPLHDKDTVSDTQMEPVPLKNKDNSIENDKAKLFSVKDSQETDTNSLKIENELNCPGSVDMLKIREHELMQAKIDLAKMHSEALELKAKVVDLQVTHKNNIQSAESKAVDLELKVSQLTTLLENSENERQKLYQNINSGGEQKAVESLSRALAEKEASIVGLLSEGTYTTVLTHRRNITKTNFEIEQCSQKV